MPLPPPPAGPTRAAAQPSRPTASTAATACSRPPAEGPTASASEDTRDQGEGLIFIRRQIQIQAHIYELRPLELHWRPLSTLHSLPRHPTFCGTFRLNFPENQLLFERNLPGNSNVDVIFRCETPPSCLDGAVTCDADSEVCSPSSGLCVCKAGFAGKIILNEGL